MIHSVLFDLAGTTIDCGCRAPVGVFVEVFRRHGVALDEATARGPMGTHKREHIRRLCAEPGVHRAWTEAHGAPPTEADIDALYQEAEPLQIEVLPRYSTLIPGVSPMLATLQGRGLRIGTTTGYTAPMWAVLAPLLAAQGFVPDAAACASDVPAGRPAPYMNWRVATALGAPSARSCVVLGDTPVDMAAARNAGMWAVGVSLTGNEVGLGWEALSALSPAETERARSHARARLLAAGAHVVLDQAAALPEVLAQFADEEPGRPVV